MKSFNRHTVTLNELILKNDIESISAFMDKVGDTFSVKQFFNPFLLCIKNHSFKVAHLLFTHPKGISKDSFRCVLDRGGPLHLDWSAAELTFPKGMTSKRQQALRSAFTEISHLLSRPLLCFRLLEEFDKTIADWQEKLGCDFSKIKPGKGIIVNGLLWPSPSKEETVKVKNTQGLLRYLIRKKLNSYGIETQDKMYTFSGFVDPEVANKLVRRGALFKEQYLGGNALVHGLWSHYLLWLLLAYALEDHILNFSDNLTLLEVLQATVNIKVNLWGTSAWTSLIDSYKQQDHYNFTFPHHFNSALLTSPQLPHLRGVLLNDWYRKISKLQAMIDRCSSEAISYEAIIAGQVIAGKYFDSFDLGINNDAVKSYYHSDSKTDGHLNMKTGIVTKKAPARFPKIVSLFHPEQSQTKTKRKSDEIEKESIRSTRSRMG